MDLTYINSKHTNSQKVQRKTFETLVISMDRGSSLNISGHARAAELKNHQDVEETAGDTRSAT